MGVCKHEIRQLHVLCVRTCIIAHSTTHMCLRMPHSIDTTDCSSALRWTIANATMCVFRRQLWQLTFRPERARARLTRNNVNEHRNDPDQLQSLRLGHGLLWSGLVWSGLDWLAALRGI